MQYRSNYIILINYNNYKDTIRCVESIRKQTYPNNKTIIVDNASSNDSVTILRQSCPDCILIENKENVGFSGANNIGADLACREGADIITFLNNDTELSTNFFQCLLAGIDDHQCLSPLMLYYNDRTLINCAGGYFDYRKGAGTIAKRNERLIPGELSRQEISLAQGCCITMTSKTYKTLGPWKTDYFLYREDDEYTLRMLSKGIKIIFEPQAVLYHKENASTGAAKGSAFRNYYLMRNRLYNIKLYNLGVWVELRAIASASVNYIKYLLFKRIEYKYCLKAVVDYKKGITGKQLLPE